MKERVWHKGPPPHIGWWNASTIRQWDAWRWWNGTRWSKATWAHKHIRAAVGAAKTPAFDDVQRGIQWTDYYPENARVPRVAP